MLSTVWINVLIVIFSLYNISIGICHHNNLLHDNELELVTNLFWPSVYYKNEARCVDLLKRSYNKHLLRRYWIMAEKRINPRYLQKCFSYCTDLFDQKKMKQGNKLFKRDSDTRKKEKYNKENKGESGVKEDTSGNERNSMEISTTALVPFFMDPGLGDTNRDQQVSTGSTNEDKHLETWVFIVIGVAVFLLIAASLAAGLVYHRWKLAVRQHPFSAKSSGAEVSGLIYNTQSSKSSRSTDKGTERSRSTVSTYLSKDSKEHELVQLRELPTRERSSAPIELFHKKESGYGPKSLLYGCNDMQQYSYSSKVINVLSEVPVHQTHLWASDRHDYGRSRRSGTFSSQDTLPGRSLKYLRRKEEKDFMFNDINQRARLSKFKNQESEKLARRAPSSNSMSLSRSPSHSPDNEEHVDSSRCRPAFQFSRTESKSSSSTRSYISIPPTSPSENYVEAGSNDHYLSAEHNTSHTKMTWLTKVWKGDARNELSTYQSSSGTQTESDNISDPNCLTVFGTPWQFGGTFTSRGGVMQAKDSDVCLVVVPGAVPKGEYSDIYGAIFTDTTEIRKKLIFSDRESLITPVVEYHAVPTKPFRKQVCVQLPHALPEEFDISLIRVYMFSVDEHGKIALYNMPVFKKTNDDRDVETTYWEKGPDGHSIHINTNHFSGYFCTQCETNSWPSVCTMVFGSHVQITPTRREVRVIIYIWDHRLTIKDYLERFRKQESDVDRQLLTDMQVPLLDSASSNSHLVMCMEVMGMEDNRQSWRHILRPDGSRPLFKPLQVRKLSEIVYCCRQTDPIRVEWALENVPHQIPSAVFQCCIDVMHVHESIKDYETAMKEDSDDLMRTFYVRDLIVIPNPDQVMKHDLKERPPQKQEKKASGGYRPTDLKRTLSETMDITQTEKMCQEYGISIKDIGNFRKKFRYSTVEEFQLGLLEECLRRHGQDKFVNLLPKILERLNYTQVLTALDDHKVLVNHLTKFSGVTDVSTEVKEESIGAEDYTRRKYVYTYSPNKRDRPDSPSYRGKIQENQSSGYQKQVLESSDNEFVYGTSQHKEHSKTSLSRESRQTSRQRQKSLPKDYPGDNDEMTYKQISKCQVDGNAYQRIGSEPHLEAQKSSSIEADSVLGSRSEPSRGNTSTPFLSKSSNQNTSMFAHADPQDFSKPLEKEFWDDLLKQTHKKELMGNQNHHGPYMSEEYHPYNRDEQHFTDDGLHTLPPESTSQAFHSSVSDPVPPYRKFVDSQRLHEKQQSTDKDQTSKKELYGFNTVV